MLLLLLCWQSFWGCFQHTTFAFTTTSSSSNNSNRVPSFSTQTKTTTTSSTKSQLRVSIGLGPEQAIEEEEEKKEGLENYNKPMKKNELVAGVDYEVPDHESYRLSRRSKLDEQSDKWFGALLGDDEQIGIMGSLADDARKVLTTPVPLTNEVCIKCVVFIRMKDNTRINILNLVYSHHLFLFLSEIVLRFYFDSSKYLIYYVIYLKLYYTVLKKKSNRLLCHLITKNGHHMCLRNFPGHP